MDFEQNEGEHGYPEGFVYFATNEYMPNLIKIGMTKRSPYQRLDELRSTGVIGKFELVAAYFVRDAQQSEKYLHELNLKIRAEQAREFFHVPISEYRMFAVQCGLILLQYDMIDPCIYYGFFAPDRNNSTDLYKKAAGLENEILELRNLLRRKDEYIRKAIHNID